jgi:hypothetical protein
MRFKARFALGAALRAHAKPRRLASIHGREGRLDAVIRRLAGCRRGVFKGKRVVHASAPRIAGAESDFPLPIMILEHRAATAPRARLVASTQHGDRVTNCGTPLPCHRVRPFGTMGRNFSKELRRFRWQAQKVVSLPNLSDRGETQ